MGKFGLSLKRNKKKTKAELWQEGVPPPKPDPYNPGLQNEEHDRQPTDPPYDEEQGDEARYNRNLSQRSHPEYDPYTADYYIPSSNRRSQFDNSVLMQRELDAKNGDYNGYNDESEPTAPYPEAPYRSPEKQYGYDRSYEEPPWKHEPYSKQATGYSVAQPYDESDYSARTDSYPAKQDFQNYQMEQDSSEPRRENVSQEPELSDINEDQERYFQQQEWRDNRSEDGRGRRSYGAKLVEMCDNVAEGVSEALSRFFNSASLFCKTCFWSRSTS